MTEHLLYKGIVHPWHCDVMGHMNVRHYMGMFDDASYLLIAEATGWQANADEWQGKGWADVSHSIEYLAEVCAGELVEIVGSVTAIGKRSFTANYIMRDKVSGTELATLQAKLVYFDLIIRKSMEIENTVLKVIQQYT